MTKEYFARNRKHVYVTPRTFLSFLAFYEPLYKSKYEVLNVQANNFSIGLQKIAEASDEIAKMGEELKKQEVVLKKAVDKTDKFVE